MKPIEFIKDLQRLISGTIDDERYEGVLAGFPRIEMDYRDHYVKVDFVSPSELRLDINIKPPQRLRIRKEGLASRLLGNFGVVCDHKTGDLDFDRKYIIDNSTAEWAKAFLIKEVRDRIDELGPFFFFELSKKDYRCFKPVNISKYTPENAKRDVDTMINIVELAQRINSGTFK